MLMVFGADCANARLEMIAGTESAPASPAPALSTARREKFMFVIVVPLVVGRSRAGRFELGAGCFSIFPRRLFSEASGTIEAARRSQEA
jgi:hypothetical protein